MRNRLLLRIQQGLVRHVMTAKDNHPSDSDVILSYRSLLQWFTKSQCSSTEDATDVMVAMNVAMCLSIAKTIGNSCK